MDAVQLAETGYKADRLSYVWPAVLRDGDSRKACTSDLRQSRVRHCWPELCRDRGLVERAYPLRSRLRPISDSLVRLSQILRVGVYIPKSSIYFAMGFSVFVEFLNTQITRRKKPPVKLRRATLRPTVGIASQAGPSAAAP